MKLVIPRFIGLHPEGLEVARTKALEKRSEVATNKLAWAALKREKIAEILPNIPIRKKVYPQNLTMREHLENIDKRLIERPEVEADRELFIRDKGIKSIEEEATLRISYVN
jgi:hypothetical protein